MPKRGQHDHDAINPSQPKGHDQSLGPNHPDRTQRITTGTYKKPETYKKEAYAHSSNTSDRRTQSSFDPWDEDTRDVPTTEGSPRARRSDITGGRSGSDSNADAGTRGH